MKEDRKKKGMLNIYTHLLQQPLTHACRHTHTHKCLLMLREKVEVGKHAWWPG